MVAVIQQQQIAFIKCQKMHGMLYIICFNLIIIVKQDPKIEKLKLRNLHDKVMSHS